MTSLELLWLDCIKTTSKGLTFLCSIPSLTYLRINPLTTKVKYEHEAILALANHTHLRHLHIEVRHFLWDFYFLTSFLLCISFVFGSTDFHSACIGFSRFLSGFSKSVIAYFIMLSLLFFDSSFVLLRLWICSSFFFLISFYAFSAHCFLCPLDCCSCSCCCCCCCCLLLFVYLCVCVCVCVCVFKRNIWTAEDVECILMKSNSVAIMYISRTMSVYRESDSDGDEGQCEVFM